jgi:hypothetical protein
VSGPDDPLGRRAKEGTLDETFSVEVQHHQIDLFLVGDAGLVKLFKAVSDRQDFWGRGG